MTGLRIEPVDEDGAHAIETRPPRDLLALVRFGSESTPPGDAVHPFPVERLDGVFGEAWYGTGAVRRRRSDRLRLADDGAHLFAAIDTVTGEGDDLEPLARETYETLLRSAEREGFPHVLRAWNTVARINGVTLGLDRYQLFCKGRADAYAALWGPGFEGRLPSCSAVGGRGGGLSVHMLASRRAGRSVENPRQVSAYRYPTRYGPKSPSFARGLVAPPESGGWVFVSGTASIVGHESVHADDPAAQTDETLRNVAAVLDEAGCPGRGEPPGRRLHSLRVYLRRRADLGPIRETVDRWAGGPVPTAWLLADVCRPELLVEIEGIGRGRVSGPPLLSSDGRRAAGTRW